MKKEMKKKWGIWTKSKETEETKIPNEIYEPRMDYTSK